MIAGRTRRLIHALMATTVLASAIPASVFGQAATQRPAATATAIPVIPPAIRPMTPAEKAEYDGWLYQAKSAALSGDLATASAIYEKIVAKAASVYGTNHVYFADVLIAQGHIVSIYINDATAKTLYEKALQIRENFYGKNHYKTREIYSYLELVALSQGEKESSKNQGSASQDYSPKDSTNGDATRVISMITNAGNIFAQGRPFEAENIIKSNMDFLANLPKNLDYMYASALLALSEFLSEQGKFLEAEQYLRQSTSLLKNSPVAALSASSRLNLAVNLLNQGICSEAEGLIRAEAPYFDSLNKTTNQAYAAPYMSLAMTLICNGNYTEALPLIQRSIFINEKRFGRESFQVAENLEDLGDLYASNGKTQNAIENFAMSLKIFERIRGINHPTTLRIKLKTQVISGGTGVEETLEGIIRLHESSQYSSSNLAAFAYELRSGLRLLRSSAVDALQDARLSLALRRRVEFRENNGIESQAQEKVIEKTAGPALLLQRAAWSVRVNSGNKETVKLRAEAFDAAQSGGYSGAGRALARQAARQSLTEEGQEVVRQWETLLDQRAALNQRFTAAAGLSGPDGDAQRSRLGQERVRLDSEVKVAEERLRSGYPQFFQLIAPGPVSLEELQTSVAGRQALLGANEALILISPGDTRMPKGQQRGLVFAVTRETIAWAEIGEEPAALSADVCRLRSLLDPGNVNACDPAGVASSSTVTPTPTRGGIKSRAPSSGPRPTGAQRGYDRATARRVYDALFGSPEIAKLIAGKSEWIISPQGVLLSLPFAALVAGDYTGDDAEVADLRTTPWLGMAKALSVIPEVSSLKALRGLSRPARATQTPFFGMGDPDFARGAGGAVPLTTVVAASPGGAPNQVRSYFRDAGADLDAVSKLAPLPGTKTEIEALAKSLKAIPGSILLGDDATEKNLRARSDNGSLARVRVVAFATHGLIAGDLGRSLAQPALAFTPPAPSAGPVTEANDGLLTASEAATLKLGADWVILSACNTAAGNGNNSADGLTGLARAFFYAGADTLLVSHWRVRDDAAARLTTRAVEIAAATPAGSQKPSRAAALQQSMKELMNDTSQDKSGNAFAHPSAWAPFTLVGVER